MEPYIRPLMMGAAGTGGATYIEDVFSTWLYTGNGSTQTITNGIDLSGKGGMVWIKQRNGTEYHNVFDTARGSANVIFTNVSDAQGSSPTRLTSFDSTGFTVGSNTGTNGNSSTYASWTFRKQAKFFDVVTYTGDGVAGRTVSHNLGSTPGCIIIKCVDSTDAWRVYHRSAAGSPETVGLTLNNTGSRTTSTSFWNDTTPTSTHFTVGTNSTVNALGQNYVAYLFAHDANGFGDSGNDSVIKCGSYTGLGSTTGPVVDLGWEPQFVIIKAASTTGNWFVIDNMRGFVSSAPSSAETSYLSANTVDSESLLAVAISSTGFVIRTSGTAVNGSGNTYIYIAIRRGPMRTPTDATKVFLASTGSGKITTGFPVDTWIGAWRSGGDSSSPYTASRLVAPYQLTTSSTAAEVNGSWTPWDSNTQFVAGGGISTGFASYLFRRAPSFMDVVAYTGTGSVRTVSHNLGVAPELIIIKNRTAYSWVVYAAPITASNNLILNETGASEPNGSAYFNSTAPTASVFSLGTNVRVNQSSAGHIAYLFASCPGVSKCGSYTGTGTTLQVNCGFTSGARFVLIKRTDSTGDWYVWDSARGIVAGNDPYLLLNSTAAEVTNTDYVDTFSAGFEISSTAPAEINANGGTFIFLAIA